MFSKSSMKEEDIKNLIYTVKKEFQQEINALNDRISNLERKNQHLEEYNNNLNTFIQHHFERLDRKTDENHTYILNMWNPFMQSTIEKVKDDLIKSINDNKKDDVELSKKVDKLTGQVNSITEYDDRNIMTKVNELSKQINNNTQYDDIKLKVDTLAIQISSLNKMVVDEGFVNIALICGSNGSLNFIPIKKNIEVFDLFDKDIFFYGAFFNQKIAYSGTHNVCFNPKHLNLFPNLKKINLTKMLNTYFNPLESPTFCSSVNFMLNNIVDKDYIYDLTINNHQFLKIDLNNPNNRTVFKENERIRNIQIDILKNYIKTNFPHIEII